MDAKTLTAINEKVYRKFPEVKGKRPTKRSQPNDNTLLIYKGSGKAPNGTIIDRIVRVTVSPNGKIIKMSTSR